MCRTVMLLTYIMGFYKSGQNIRNFFSLGQANLQKWLRLRQTGHYKVCSSRCVSLHGNVAPSLGSCLVLDTSSMHALQTATESLPSAQTESGNVYKNEGPCLGQIDRQIDTIQWAVVFCSYLVAYHSLPFRWISKQAQNKHTIIISSICQTTVYINTFPSNISVINHNCLHIVLCTDNCHNSNCCEQKEALWL